MCTKYLAMKQNYQYIGEVPRMTKTAWV